MARNHSGNLLNSVTYEEHDGDLNAKKVSLVSSATIFAVVDIASGESVGINSNVTLNPSPNFIGLVTIANASLPVSFAGNVTLDPGSRTGIVGNVTLSDSKGFIGLVTIGNTPNFVNVGNVTVEQGDDPWNVAVKGNVTLTDSKTFIGLVSVSGFANPLAVTQSGTWDEVGINDSGNSITIDGSVGVTGNVTLSDPKGFIGLVTVVQSSTARTITGNVTLSDAKTYVGLVTATIGNTPNVAVVGNVTLSGTANVAVIGNVTISGTANVAPIGNVTLSDSKTFIGLVTVVQSSAARTITGNITISDSKGFIGLTTSVPAYGSNSTVFTGVISATGFATVVIAPASNRFFVKNLHISSLGRSEVEVRSGATAIIPFTSLSTTSGFASHYGEMGLPARAQTDALVLNLNGGATISYMVNVRFEA